jgi:hypothetical protein
VKLREFLKRLRFSSAPARDGQQQEDKLDALSTTLHGLDPGVYGAGTSAPTTNWVPSQQDEKPRY